MPRRPNRFARLALAAACCAPLAAVLPGCNIVRQWQPMTAHKAVLPPDASKEQVVAHLNKNIERCTGWRSDAEVKAKGMPFGLRATVAVQSPRNFRMLASIMGNDQADFGSNGDRMWFWIRQMPADQRFVYTCSHEDLPAAQQSLPIPFQPDWLMEVLGVIPINPTAFQMVPFPGDEGLVQLTASETTPAGESVTRQITVDTRRGVVTAHTLRGQDGSLIAEAKLGDYKPDKKTGVLLPHRVDVNWPDAQTEMTLTLGDIEVNPPNIPATVWNPQRVADCPTFDFGQKKFVERL